MRIVLPMSYWFPDSPGGSGKLAFDESQFLVGCGHEVWAVAQDAIGAGPGYEYTQGVNLLRYQRPSIGSFDPRRSTIHQYHTRRLIQQYVPQADVVHGHGLLQYAGAIGIYGDRVRSIYSVHSPVRMEMSATAQMDWQQVRLDWHLHMDLVKEAYSGREMAIMEGQKALSQQFERVMVNLLARSLVLEPDRSVCDGIRLAHDLNMHALAASVEMLRHSPVLRRMAKRLLLPLHYAQLEKSRLRARADAISYCPSHPEFARDVERLSYATDAL